MTAIASSAVGSTTRELDRLLGNPRDDSSVMSFRRSLELDRAAMFPAEAAGVLDAWGLPRFYIPQEFGGALERSSRAGSAHPPCGPARSHRRRRTRQDLPRRGVRVGGRRSGCRPDGVDRRFRTTQCRGGSPRKGGAATSPVPRRRRRSVPTRSVVDGGKWPIGNATRGQAIAVLARTDSTPGPRALSLVLVEKDKVDAATLSYRPRLRTHGIRGADISGIDFANTRVDADALIGAPGQGLELVLKSLQLTRTLCSALSLGSADQAIDIVLDAGCGSDRSPHSRIGDRTIVARAVADLVFAEAVGYTGVRHIHSFPEEMALESAFVKFLVPDAVDLIYRELARVLGGSAQVIGAAGPARFEKASRDNRVVGIFDGNSVVNLNVMINEFPNIAKSDDASRARGRGRGAGSPGARRASGAGATSTDDPARLEPPARASGARRRSRRRPSPPRDGRRGTRTGV